ncbi:hypothetical protein H6G91_17085 [Nostoc muscorum FACHB-395]|jgi:hypothetical protein|nr:hypothetical protein [Desmonostoc muscorum FACHB-395]
MTAAKDFTFIAVRVTTEERDLIREVSTQTQTTISDIMRAGFGLPPKEKTGHSSVVSKESRRAAKVAKSSQVSKSSQA